MLCPISLRPHPTIPGDFVINHGHRRYLGTIEAGLQEIPAYEDPDFDKFDQVMENLHHEQLTGREMADFIGTKLAQGMSQAEVARRMGKSAAWVSMHVAMLNLPEPVAEAVANGQVTDVTLAKALAVAHRENPDAVNAVLADGAKPTRSTVKKIRNEAAKAKPSPLRKPNAKAELQHQLGRDAQFRREQADPSLHQEGVDALYRLLTIAEQHTGQSKRVADFLLAWWNAATCGGFDPTDLWNVDHKIADDMMRVLSLIRRARAYPDKLSPTIHESFKALVKNRRPHLIDD